MKEETQASISDLIIAMLQSGRNVSTFRRILRERQLNQYKEKSIRKALYRLRSKGYVENSSQGWLVTKEGRMHGINRNLLSYIPSPFESTDPRNTILSFDIPEQNRFLRNWLRNQIKIFGYKMLQQSLWIGPGPLPPSFIKRLEDLEIRKNVRTFRVVLKK